ncbi:hypothetical protein H6F50_10465 [Coleofasciculus sp. FACHB-712]|uniref:hypothetical protein n=1 Tax=Coleofasciculus sp. FACHB-712 TaxID=2692789 RepID=UPI0016867E53|nr:hypothetical protein [Coleofasciculus sp. FACHB-712]MBD1942775.1 hypothetical protein [Coleofasciculus sp. FACHB-712]
MLRIAIVALLTLEIVLLSALALSPANATSSDFENYIWSFADVGSHQVVCKKIVMHPEKQLQSGESGRQVVKMSSTSTVVSHSYCAASTKPVVGS